ncbi:ATP-dependent helicase Lhr and Lhr-like helicase [Rhizobiales bacterium GAS113]|nr:ATP-dependent helicase Lhr and Lhr-like helicase [Rhizobiales bacterium GAS113]
MPEPSNLPQPFAGWFAMRGWAPRTHQLELIGMARQGRSVLLIAPTGAGKTLAGFLPSLIELAEARSAPGGADAASSGTEAGGAAKPGARGKRAKRRLHTLYVSPLKALAADVQRNLETPLREMELPIRVETRTGDTSAFARQRQKTAPPDILLTTPEQVALLLAAKESRELFGSLRRVIIDELHSLVTSKRGDLLALDLARLKAIAPGLASVGLSATVREPQALQLWLGATRALDAERPRASLADLVTAGGAAPADLTILETEAPLPLAGHITRHALPEIYAAIRSHKMTLVFVNTRMQAEFLFQALWRMNEDSLPIALHHGSLDAAQRKKVEAAMAQGRLKAVVCTSTLDLGIDWGDVDLVINVGAPKGASRLMQRIGRANHRLDEPSKAVIVPSNRFEALEAEAALEAVEAAAQDTPDARRGALDVLAQHVLGVACGDPFLADELYAETVSTAPYAELTRESFETVLQFVATGGYALRSYERFAKIRQGRDGRWRAATASVIQQYRLNVGTIVEAAMLKVRLGRLRAARPGAPAATGLLRRSGRMLGELEEYWAEQMTVGDTFIFAGEILRFEGITENEVVASRARAGTDPKIPSYDGGKFPLSTFLAARVRAMLADPSSWSRLPEEVARWLGYQAERSLLPEQDGLLVETFPSAGRHFLVAYPFEGRLAHQTLGMLLTRRLERARLRPLGFACNDYGISVWALGDIGLAVEQGRLSLDELFGQDMLGDDLEAWLAETALMKRSFRACAIIAGLIERRHPGLQKSGRQVTISTDLVYDVLRSHEPGHILLQAAREDAATGLLDLKRLAMMLSRIVGRIRHKGLERVSPLAVSIVLEIGREAVHGEARDEILAEAEATLMQEALGAGSSGVTRMRLSERREPIPRRDHG